MATSRVASQESSVTRIAWESLPEQVQLRVLRTVWKRYSLKLRKDFPELLSVGIGYRTFKRERQELLCLGFLVQRKQSAGVQLPRFVRAQFRHQGRLAEVDVPTDVEESGGPIRLHQAAQPVNNVLGLYVMSDGNHALQCSGTACCVVTQAGGPSRYVLSCLHVLSLNTTAQNCTGVNDATTYQAPDWTPIADLADFPPMTAGQLGQVDAAIALVKPDLQVSTVVQPTRYNDGTEIVPANCTAIVTGRAAVPATFVKTHAQVSITYAGCGVMLFDCYQFTAALGEGDSGAAIVSQDGTLQAMHFAGTAETGFALGQPAGQIFQPGIFPGGDLALANG